MQSGHCGPGGGDWLDPRPVPGGFEELKQISAGNRRRPGIGQGVKIEHRRRHHGGIEHDGHPASHVIDRGKRCHRARLDAEELAQEFGGAERKPPGGAKEPVQRFQLDRGVLARDDQVWGAFFVAQEQVLGMATRNRAAQLSSTVNTAGWVTVLWAMPSLSR
jgi:hypothetical protein